MSLNTKFKCFTVALVVLLAALFAIKTLYFDRTSELPVVPVAESSAVYSFELPVVPRKVYYDNRTVLGKPRNLVCILAEVSEIVFKGKITVLCELNGYFSRGVEIIKDPITGWIKNTFGNRYSHFLAVIRCSGFPYEAITNGSVVSVLFKRKDEDSFLEVQAKRTLYLVPMPQNKTTPTKGINSVVVCTTAYDRPPLFKEWFKYHKLLGIDKLHLNVDKSFYENATLVYPFLKDAIQSGFVSMELWERNTNLFYYSQSLKYQDCIMRYQGVFDFAIMLDLDDFFVPLIAGEKDIHFYGKMLFKNNLVESVKISWKLFDCKMYQNILANLRNGSVSNTNTLNSHVIKTHSQSKVMARLSAVDVITIHFSSTSLPGFLSNRPGPSHSLYIAHIKRLQTSECM